MIDIPGIGNVEAKNAATEATLKAILKAMQGIQKSGGAGGAAGGAGGAAATKALAGAGQGGAGAAKGLAGAASSAGKLGQAFGKLAGGPVGMVAGALVGLGEGVTNVISKFANMGDSVEAAAGVFSGIPLVGTMFGAVAAASQKVTDSYLTSAKSGATFGGSMTQFAASASAAGMTLDKFGALIGQNGASMLAFGSTTESGAKRFSSVAKQLQANASGLQALGYSTEDINKGLVNYGALLRMQGRDRGKSDADLTRGAKEYLKEIDALAKVTGLERSAAEAKLKEEMENAQFAAAMSEKSDGVQKSFGSLMATASSASPELAAMMRDFTTTGSFTNDENAKTASLMGKGAQDALSELRRMFVAGETMTAAKQDAIFAQLGAAGKGMMKQFGGTLAATGGEYDHAIKAQIGLNKLSGASRVAADKAQDKAAAETDGMNIKMQEAQKSIARVSNEFQMFLANSGILDTMLTAFKGLASFVQTFIMPIFSIFSFAIKNIVELLFVFVPPLRAIIAVFSLIKIAFEEVGNVLSTFGLSFKPLTDVVDQVKGVFTAMLDIVGSVVRVGFRSLLDIFLKVSDTVEDYLYPVLRLLGRIGDSLVDLFNKTVLPAIESVAEFFVKDFIPPIVAVFNDIWNFIKPAIDPLVKAFDFVEEKLTIMKEAVGNFLRSFNTIGEVVDLLKLSFKELGLNLKEMWYRIKDFIPGLSVTPEERKALAAEKAVLAADKQEVMSKLGKNAATNLQLQQDQEARGAKEREERDRKIGANREATDIRIGANQVALDKKGATERKTAEEKAADDKLNANAGPEALLKSFDAQQGGKLTDAAGQPIPPKSGEVDAARRAIEADAEKKRREQEDSAAKTKTAADAKTAEAAGKPENNNRNPAASGQESAESLLAQLNSSIAKLIKINEDNKSINEQQLSSIRGLTGNLYAG